MNKTIIAGIAAAGILAATGCGSTHPAGSKITSPTATASALPQLSKPMQKVICDAVNLVQDGGSTYPRTVKMVITVLGQVQHQTINQAQGWQLIRQTVAKDCPQWIVPAALPAAAVSTPAPAPSTNGTYQGSCDYTLGNNPAGGTANLVGEVDLSNTGNVGTIVRVKITWPQEGYPPIKASKTVRTGYGQSKAVRFHVAASGNMIDLLQAWQTGHNYRDGCTYYAATGPARRKLRR